MNPVVNVIRTRRSVGQGSFDSSRPVPHETVLEAIESARWAPNHKRTEPWTFHLLDRDRIVALAGVNRERMVRAGSRPDVIEAKYSEWSSVPGVMVLTCTDAPEADAVMQRENYAATACAAQNFMLHLWSEGIASKWSTAAVDRVDGFWQLLGHADRPGNTSLTGLFFYGYADVMPRASRNKDAASVTVDFTTGHQGA